MDTAIIAIATVLGPVIAVCLTLFVQYRFNASQNRFQKELMDQLERDRRDWEMQRENAKGAYDDAWNVANRDRFDRLVRAIEKLSDNKTTG